MKGLSKKYKAGIDLGSSKIVCWVSQEDEGETPYVVGAGHTASRGVWGGQLTDVRSLQEALTGVLYEAEQKAQLQVRQAVVTLNGAFFISDYWKQEVFLPHGLVTDQDVKDVVSRIEHPDYIRAECLTPDYYHYITNQLMKPLAQVFELILEQIQGFNRVQYEKDLEKWKDLPEEKYLKKVESIRLKEVSRLIFDEFI
jgi:hypothetical protein